MTHTLVKLTFEQYLEYDDGTDNRYELKVMHCFRECSTRKGNFVSTRFRLIYY